MAPFNHFGPIYPTPTVPPPSPKRTARGRRLLRDAQAGRIPNTSRGMTSGRDDGTSDQLDIKKSRSGRKLSSFTTSRRSRQRRDDIESDSADDVSGVDSDSGDDAPTSTERGLLGDAVAGVGSAVNSVLDPLVGGKSSTSVAAPEKSSAAAIESKPTAVATSASEPAVVAISSSKESSTAVVTSESAVVATSAKEQPSKLPDAPLSSAPSAVALPGTTGVLSPDAAATPTVSHVVPNLTRFTPEVTRAFPTPTAQLQGGDRISLSNSQATGAAGQKAQGQAIDSTTDSTTATKPEPDSDSDSDDGVESDDELDSDDEKDEPTESRLVAFTTISGTPLSTLSAVLDPTAVGTLPSNVTPVSQTGGGETTVASASAHKPPLTPQASNGLIAFGAVGKNAAIQFITPANMVQAAFFYSAL